MPAPQEYRAEIEAAIAAFTEAYENLTAAANDVEARRAELADIITKGLYYVG